MTGTLGLVGKLTLFLTALIYQPLLSRTHFVYSDLRKSGTTCVQGVDNILECVTDKAATLVHWARNSTQCMQTGTTSLGNNELCSLKTCSPLALHLRRWPRIRRSEALTNAERTRQRNMETVKVKKGTCGTEGDGGRNGRRGGGGRGSRLVDIWVGCLGPCCSLDEMQRTIPT